MKQDAFAHKVEDSVHYVGAHKNAVIRYGGALVAILLIAGGAWYYMNSQSSARQAALADAMVIANATVGATPPQGASPDTPNYPTQAAKDDAVVKAFTGVKNNYSGSDEAYVAEFFLANKAIDAGKLDDALKQFQDVADHASANYASLAKFALGQTKVAMKQTAAGQAVLKDLMDHPTDLVSKETATTAYAKSIASTNPAESQKLLSGIAADAAKK